MKFLQQQLAGYPGAWVVYAIDDSLPAPIGFIWYRYPMTQVVELLYVFTHEDFRRIGVATQLLNWLKSQYPTSTIAGGKVNEMSKDWCLKHNFIQTTNGWFLMPKEN